LGVTADAIVGRAQELAAVAGFVDAAVEGPGGLLLEGEAGVGKTTLWQAGVDRALAGTAAVLVARPTDREAGFAFAAIGDLLAGREVVFDVLPEPQRHALRVALSLETAGDDPLEERVVALAVLNALRELAHQGPVVLAVDDVQWLDRSSLVTLEFAARRLRAEPVRFLVTRRTGEGEEPQLPEPTEVVAVGPLSLGALQRLLADRLETSLPRQTLRRLWEISAGNPFYALELARALLRRGSRFAIGDEVPIPTDLSTLLQERLAGLGAETRSTLLAAALVSDPTPDVLDAVDGQGAWQRLEPAASAHVVELDGSRIRFSHPLLAAAVASAADPRQKRDVHRRLAALGRDPQERAVHLALSAEPPDEEVAGLLDEAAEDALARGSAYAAADLAQEALRFTDPGSERWLDRLFADCECKLRIGSTEEATARLHELLATLPPGSQRARAFLLLVPASRSGLTRADVERALEDAGDDARLRALILLETMGGYSIVGLGLLENVAETAATLAEAAELARSIGDASLESRALVDMAWTEYALGRPLDPELRPLEGGLLHELLLHPDRIRASQKICRGEYAEAAALLEPLRERAAAEEEEWSQFVFTLQLFDLESRRGDWPAARERLAELENVGAGIGAARSALLRCAGHVAAVRGDRRAADEAAAAVLAASDASGWQRLFAMQVQGVAALAAGAAEDAVGPLAAASGSMMRAGFREPGSVPVVAELIEALFLAGRQEEAAAELDRLESLAAELSHPWGLAQAARCRGLLNGDESSLREAVARTEALSMPFDRARSLLALGRLLLRERRRAAAREALKDALEVFTALGTPPWADQTRAELARIGGRTASPDELTPAEKRVAALVADGRTNNEVAAELFLSVNTVESTLRRVYRKLGIRSRAELARRFTAD